MQKHPITPTGYKKMQQHLQHMKSVLRPQVVKEVEIAMSHGDLGENAEYHAAKERLGVLGAQMSRIETRLANSEIIDPKTFASQDKIVFGATVTLMDTQTNDEVTYQIVGDDETDAPKGRIGISSPVARGLIGKSSLDEVKIQTPGGVREFEVVKIEYR